MKEKLYLFSYGTLKNKEIQKILLGEEVETQDAFLMDLRLYNDNVDNYYLRQLA